MLANRTSACGTARCRKKPNSCGRKVLSHVTPSRRANRTGSTRLQVPTPDDCSKGLKRRRRAAANKSGYLLILIPRVTPFAFRLGRDFHVCFTPQAFADTLNADQVGVASLHFNEADLIGLCVPNPVAHFKLRCFSHVSIVAHVLKPTHKRTSMLNSFYVRPIIQMPVSKEKPGAYQMKTGKVVLLIAAAAFAGMPLFSQTSQIPKPSFEVISIKPTAPSTNFIRGGGARGDKYTMTGAILRMLLQNAYQRPSTGGPAGQLQIIGGPSWIDSDRYDIQATADCSHGVLSRDQVQLMVQSMLEDRFQLKAHMETRELPIYNLVVAKDGPKLKTSEDQTPPAVGGPPQPCGPVPDAPALPPFPPPAPGARGGPIRSSRTGRDNVHRSGSRSIAVHRYPGTRIEIGIGQRTGARVSRRFGSKTNGELKTSRCPFRRTYD